MGNTHAGNPDQESMKCAILTGPREKLLVEDRELPRPKYGEILVKVEAAPINPSDVAFTQGTYNFLDSYPTKCGFEGAGTVVASGGGFMARRLIGKKIAFISNDASGSWGQYHVVSADFCASLGNNEDMSKAACSFVNPMTSLAFLDLVLAGGHKAIVQTAACSALGKMSVKLFKEFNIRVINVVRRDDQAKILFENGADLVLNSEDEDFDSRLKEATKGLGASAVFDAVGGELAERIFALMPERSIFYLYGLLSNKHIQNIHITELMGKRKVLAGFHLKNWFTKASLKSKALLFYRFNKYRKTLLASPIAATYPLSEINEALDFYKKNMSKGKVIILPNPQE